MNPQSRQNTHRKRAAALLQYMQRHAPTSLALFENDMKSQQEGLRAAPVSHDPQEDTIYGRD